MGTDDREKFISLLQSIATAVLLGVNQAEMQRAYRDLEPITEAIVGKIEVAGKRDDDELLCVLYGFALSVAAFCGRALMAKQGEDRMLSPEQKQKILEGVGLG